MSTTTLTPAQAVTADRAREALAQPHGCETYDLAARIGILEYHLIEVLALVGQLTQPQQGG